MVFHQPWRRFLDSTTGKWLLGAHLNAAECCLATKGSKSDSSIAIVQRNEGEDDLPVQRLTLSQFRANVRSHLNLLSPFVPTSLSFASTFSWSLSELHVGLDIGSCVANALEALGLKKGDAIAIDMPMNVHAVTAYLAIILAGCVAVTIPDSFVAHEIAVRIRISKAKAIFTQVSGLYYFGTPFNQSMVQST